MVCLFVLYALTAVTVLGDDGDQQIMVSQKVRIGTFQRAKLLVAFYQSDRWDKHLREMMIQRDAAKAAGDEEKVKKIESEGVASQEVAHKQLAGEANLDNIFVHLQPVLSEIAKKANVQLIVEKPLFNDSTVEVVDVTDLLTEQFSPRSQSARTIEITTSEKPLNLLPSDLQTRFSKFMDYLRSGTFEELRSYLAPALQNISLEPFRDWRLHQSHILFVRSVYEGGPEGGISRLVVDVVMYFESGGKSSTQGVSISTWIKEGEGKEWFCSCLGLGL